MRFGAEVPFARAAGLLAAACGTRVPAATLQRLTERAGAAWGQLELALVETLEQAATDPHARPVVLPEAEVVGPDTVLQLSIDGAMVPLVHGEWTEARTAAIGQITRADDGTIQTTALSYVSHITDAATFTRLALAEFTRRGVGQAGTVVAVNDGATWIQGVLDLHCPAAVRILDLPHAAGYLAQAAQAAYGPGTAQTSDWFATQRHALRQGQSARVLSALAALPTSAERDTALGYLTARVPMLAYPAFTEAGYPIGSGCVESANKLVIAARLKGAGMHWTRAHADSMVGLRTIVEPDRWSGCWDRISQQLREQPRQAAAQRRQDRHARPDRTASRSDTDLAPPSPVVSAPAASPLTSSPPRPKLIVDGKPTPDHPWKRHGPGARPKI